MHAASRSDREMGDARVAGLSRSRLLRLPTRINFLSQEKNPELLLPSASDRAWVGAITKDQRQRLDEERPRRVQSISSSFHLSPKDFCPNYPSHRSHRRCWPVACRGSRAAPGTDGCCRAASPGIASRPRSTRGATRRSSSATSQEPWPPRRPTGRAALVPLPPPGHHASRFHAHNARPAGHRRLAVRTSAPP